MKMGTLLLGCRVPSDCIIEDHQHKVALEAGSEFIATAKRCHLSSGVYDNTHFKTRDSKAPRPDLHAEFEFYGDILVIDEGEQYRAIAPSKLWDIPEDEETKIGLRALISRFMNYGPGFETPAHWVESVIELPYKYLRDDHTTPRLTPVPQWNVDFE